MEKMRADTLRAQMRVTAPALLPGAASLAGPQLASINENMSLWAD
jgi:hypothetical protein